MNSFPNRSIPIPFIFRNTQLFSCLLHVAVHKVSLPDALVGGVKSRYGDPFWSIDLDGMLLRNIPDPGWRTYTLHDDRITYVLERNVWYYLTVAGSFERFLEDRYSSDTLESFAHDKIRFIEHFGGTLDLREYRSATELAEFQQHMHAVSIEADDELSLHQLTVGFVLFAAGVPAAYLGLQSDGEILHYVCADEAEDFYQWEAGPILHLHVFRRLLEDGQYTYVDFGPGESEIKRMFANGALRSAVVLNIRRTLYNRMLLSAFRWSRRWADQRDGHSAVPKVMRAALSF